MLTVDNSPRPHAELAVSQCVAHQVIWVITWHAQVTGTYLLQCLLDAIKYAGSSLSAVVKLTDLLA